MFSLRIFIVVLTLLAILQSGRSETTVGTLEKHLFNRKTETINYEIDRNGANKWIKAISKGRDRIWSTETHYEFVADPNGTRETLEVVEARFKPPKTTLISENGKQRVEKDGETVSVTTHDVDLVLALSIGGPLSYLTLVEHWLESGKPESIRIFDGAVVFDPRIEFANPVKISGKLFQCYRIDAGLGEAYMFFDDSSKLACIINGPWDIFDPKRRALLPAFKESVVNQELIENQKIYRQALLRRGPYRLINATLVDIRNGELVEDALLEVDGDRIARLGKSGEARRQVAMPEIDLDGKFVIPGLFDMHSHLYFTEQAINYLAGGITSIREMGGNLDIKVLLRDAYHNPNYLGPNTWLWGLVDGEGPGPFGDLIVSSPDEVPAVMNRFEALGMHGVKIYNQISPEVLQAFGIETKKREMPMGGHLPNEVTVAFALENGMVYFSHDQTRGRTGERQQNAKLITNHGGWVDPNRAWAEILRRPFEAPLTLIDTQSTSWTDGLKREVARYGSDQPIEEWDERFPNIMNVLRICIEEGVQLLPGTDTAGGSSTLHRELELFVQFGMTPLEALQSATLNSAIAMGEEDSYGSIEEGKIADIVVLSENPLESIDAIRRPKIVIKGGEILDVSVLRAHGAYVDP